MASKLVVGFKETHHKGFSKALLAAPPPVKKSRPEVSRKEPILDALVVQVPTIEAIRLSQELVVSPLSEVKMGPLQLLQVAMLRRKTFQLLLQARRILERY